MAKQAWTGSSFNTFFLDIPALGPRPLLQGASLLSPPLAAHPFSIPQKLFYSNLLPIIGISADSLLALSIITADLLLPILQYIRLLKTSSPPQNEEVILLQIRNYLQNSGMTAFQFLRATGSRASYERRFYETNPNGCCGVIAPYQCRQRDHIDTTSPLRNFVRPISFHDSQERESFLQYIDHLISTSTSPEATSCLSNMRGWILSNFRRDMDNTITPQLDSSGWWKAEWLSSVDLDTRFTYFCNSPTIPHHKLPDPKKHNYLIAYLSSSTRAQYLFSLDDIKQMVTSLNYFQHGPDHFLLMTDPIPDREIIRYDQALDDLSRTSLQLFSTYPSLMHTWPLHQDPELVDRSHPSSTTRLIQSKQSSTDWSKF